MPATERPRGWRVWFAATRPAFLGITAVAVLVGLAAAASEGLALDPLRAVLTLAGALLVHAGANVVNDFHDRHADEGNEDRIAKHATAHYRAMNALGRATSAPPSRRTSDSPR